MPASPAEVVARDGSMRATDACRGSERSGDRLRQICRFRTDQMKASYQKCMSDTTIVTAQSAV